MNFAFLLFALTVGTVVLDRVNVYSTISVPQLTAVLFFFLVITLHLAKKIDTKVSKSSIVIVILILLFISFEVLSGIVNGVSNGMPALIRSRAISLILFFSGSIGAYKYLLYNNKTQAETLLNVMLISGIVLLLTLVISSLGLYQLETVVNTPHRYYFSEWMSYRTTGILMNYGDLSIWLSLTCAIALHKYVSSGKKKYSITFLLLLPLGIIATESRNVLLALSATIVFFFWYISIQQLRGTTKNVLITIFIALIFTLIAFNHETIIQIYDTQIALRGKTDSRLGQYAGTLNYMLEHPFLGAGPGNLKFTAEQVEAGIFEVPVHNILLQAASRSGVGSIFILVCLIYIGIKLRAGSLKNTIPAYVFPAYIGFIIAIQFYPPLSYGSPVFWVPLGIYATFASQCNSKKSRFSRQSLSVLNELADFK